jgi:hypothetical protein
MGWKKLHAAMSVHLDGVSESAGRIGLLRGLQDWLRKYQAEFGSSLNERYGMDEYCRMDLSRYPVDRASFDASEEIHQLRRVPPVSLETLAMRVRDVFWSNITLESEISCPTCGAGGLRVLRDVQSEDPVLACDNCAWAQTINGERRQSSSKLVPPTVEILDEWARFFGRHAFHLGGS